MLMEINLKNKVFSIECMKQVVLVMIIELWLTPFKFTIETLIILGPFTLSF